MELQLLDAIVKLFGDFVKIVGSDNRLSFGKDSLYLIVTLPYLVKVILYLLDFLFIKGDFDEVHVCFDGVAHKFDRLEVLFDESSGTLLSFLHHFNLLLLHVVQLLLQVSEFLLELWQVDKSLPIDPLAYSLDSSFGDVRVHPSDFILEPLHLLLQLHDWDLHFH